MSGCSGMSRTVRLKGFRPGKVPVKVVRQQFGQQVRQEVLGDVMQSSFAEAVEQEKLTPAGGPRIEPINIEQGGSQVPRRVRDRAADRAQGPRHACRSSARWRTSPPPTSTP